MADAINEGVEKFKSIMDAAIKEGNRQISSAADKVRNCGGLNPKKSEPQVI